jgi:membrane-associated protease RseP (regulator of RpoE activity)
MRLGGVAVAIAATAMLSGCVTPQTQYSAATPVAVTAEAQKQKELLVQEAVRDRTRLATVSAPLVAANVELCREVVIGSLGFGWWNLGDLPRELNEAAAAAYNLTAVPQVNFVHLGGPADRAGIKLGDQLVALDGRDLPVGDDAARQARDRVREIMKGGRAALRPIDVVLRRNGLRVQASVDPVLVCDFPVVVDNSDRVNAYADGVSVKITRGMLRFAENDHELAVVLGHELAHNVMGHLSAKKTNAVMAGAGGFVVDVLIAAAVGVNTGGAFTKAAMDAGGGAFSSDFEREADYVGVYMMARAGFAIEAAPNFWRRMATRDPKSIDHASTHPSTAERAASLETAVEEIHRKQAAGQPVLPEFKPVLATESNLQSGESK